MNARALSLAFAAVLLCASSALGQGYGQPTPWEQALGDLRSQAEDWANDVGRNAAEGVEHAMGGAAQAHQQVSEGMETASTMMEGHNALSDLDRQLDGALDQPEPGTPPVPASCVGREGCAECYAGVYERLARSRLLLARARALFDATHRFANAAQAVGDNLAPSTREAAFVWEMQKPRIAASLGQFDAAYDRKIADMLAALRRTLQDISECEGRFYNNPDWYQRFGFVYHEFLKSRYER